MKSVKSVVISLKPGCWNLELSPPPAFFFVCLVYFAVKNRLRNAS